MSENVKDLAMQVSNGALSVEEAAPKIAALIQAAPPQDPPQTVEQQVVEGMDFYSNPNSVIALESTKFGFSDRSVHEALYQAVFAALAAAAGESLPV